jgi:protein-disulfide isomerase
VLASVATVGTAIGGCERSTDLEQHPADASALFEGIPQQGMALGDPAAPVTITEMSDLRCSHCRNFTLEALPVLVERYVRPGRVRIVLRNLPVLGEASQRAARVAVAASLQNRMWQFVDVYFQSQAATDPSDASLRRVAEAVPGLDAERVMTDRDAPEVKAQLDESLRLAREKHVRGVPSFTIGRTGGGPVREIVFQRSSDPEPFIAAIEAELSSEPEAP